MSWDHLPIDAGAHDHAMPSWEAVAELVEAINERTAAAGTGLGAIAEFDQYDELNKAVRIYEMQSYLEALAPRYMKQDLNLSLFNAVEVQTGALFVPIYDDALSNSLFDLTAWRAASGIPSGGFTRKYRDSGGSVVTGVGLIQAGDFIGKWLWNEMYEGCRAMRSRVFFDTRATALGGVGYSSRTSVALTKTGAAGAFDDTRALSVIQAEAVAAFNADEAENIGSSGRHLSQITSYSTGGIGVNLVSDTSFAAGFRVDEGALGIEADATWYSRAHEADEDTTFDAGPFGLVEGEWTAVQQEDGLTSTILSAPSILKALYSMPALVSSFQVPAWPTAAPDTPVAGNESAFRGCSFSQVPNDIMIVADFNFTQESA